MRVYTASATAEKQKNGPKRKWKGCTEVLRLWKQANNVGVTVQL